MSGVLRPPIETVLDALRTARCDPQEKSGKWLAKCPAHLDENPSLAVDVGNDGKVLVTCRSHHCTFSQIAAALKISETDFYPHSSNGKPHTSKPASFADDQAFLDFIKDWTFLFPSGQHVNRIAQLGFNTDPYSAVDAKATKWRDKHVIVIEAPGNPHADATAAICLERGASEVLIWQVTDDSLTDQVDFKMLVRFEEPWRDNGASVRKVERKIEVNYAPDDPHRLGRIYLATHCQHQGKRTLVYHRGEFHRWEESAYRPVADHEVNGKTNRISRLEFDRLCKVATEAWEKSGRKGDPPTARKVGMRLIGDIKAAIQSETILPDRVEAPAWLIKNPPFPACDVLPTKTALVHLPSFVLGKPRAIAEPTPSFFCPYALDYGFDPNAPIPQAWIDFLVSVWPKDPESIDALQEWLGYLLTLDTSQQKIAMLIGPPRSGRGTISRVIGGLAGPANVANPTFAGLASQFGAACLIGKPVAIIGDARQSHRSDWAIALERLLMISGEDAMTIDRKNRPDWTGRLPTRLILISNELPKFTDSSGALAARLLLFRFTESFVGREDKTLDAKLKAELPGILLWAIEGWERLRKRGHFLQPKSGQNLVDQFQDLASPIGAYVRERIKVGPGFRIKVDELFEDWKTWCAGRNRQPGELTVFGRNLRTVIPTLVTKQMREKRSKTRVRCFEGLKLKPGPIF